MRNCSYLELEEEPMKKRLIAMLLVVALSVGLLASTVSAAGIFEPSHMFGNIVHAQLKDQ